MTLALISFSLIVCLGVLLFSHFSFFVISRKRTYVFLKFACFFLLVYPKKGKTKQRFTSRRNQNGRLNLFPQQLQTLPEDIAKRFPTIHIKVKRLIVYVGSEDASQTAYLTTLIGHTINSSATLLKDFFPKIKIEEGYVYPCFHLQKTYFDINFSISFPFYQFIKLILYLYSYQAKGNKYARKRIS